MTLLFLNFPVCDIFLFTLIILHYLFFLGPLLQFFVFSVLFRVSLPWVPFFSSLSDYWYPLCCAWIGCWKYQPYKDEHTGCFIGCCPTPFFFLLPAPDMALAQSSQVQGDGAVGALKCGPGMRTGESSNISFSGAKNKNVL